MSYIKFLSHSYIKFLFKTWVLFLFLFFTIRCAFYFANHNPELQSPLYTEAFFIGIRFDNVIICYCFMIPFLLLSTASFLKHKLFLSRIAFYFICFSSFIILLTCCANIPYYKQFGSVISKNALLWQASPKMVAGLIFSDFSYWGYLLVFVSLFFTAVFFIYGYFTQLKSDYADFPNQKNSHKIISLILFAALIILGARGTTSQKTTIHAGFAGISNNTFINSLGLNPCFVFFKSITSKKNNEIYKVPENISAYFKNTQQQLGISVNDSLSINRIISVKTSQKKLNVIVVLMESMAMYKLGYWGGKNLMPNFTSIIKESLLFDRFFSSGIHTFNGVFSTETGFPSIYTEHSLSKYTQQPFNGTGTILNKTGYNTYFFTTHEPKFDNMEGFLKLNGYQHVIGEYDFSFSDAISTLGVPDHVLLDKVIEQLNNNKTKNPFHAFVLTASDHGPWIVPDNIDFKPSSKNEQERATQYADWAIGQFIEKAKKQSWYSSTVFMFLGDHGLYVDNTYEMPLSYNHIPYVIHCPALIQPDTISNPAYQPDVMPTIMGLLNITYENQSFGLDLLKEKHSSVFFSADDKYAVMNENGFYYFKLNDINKSHLKNGLKIEDRDYFNQKNNLADSLEKQAASIIETARYIVRKNYYNK